MAKSEMPPDVLPGTVFTARQVRILKWAVIVMGIMLVGGFAFVLSAIVYQASNLGESAGLPAAISSSVAMRALTIPHGMTIEHMALDDNRLALHLSGPEGGEIRIIDLGTGREITRIPTISR